MSTKQTKHLGQTRSWLRYERRATRMPRRLATTSIGFSPTLSASKRSARQGRHCCFVSAQASARPSREVERQALGFTG